MMNSRSISLVRACIVAAIAFHLSLFTFHLSAATGVLEDLPNTAPVVTNEEDAVAMAAVGALGQAMSNDVAALGSAFDVRLQDGTNAVMAEARGMVAAESNRVDATFAKRSEIPAAQDLTPYALKSELPTDYLRENDITNFASRSWISAQGYASGAEVGARIDAQDNAIAAQNAAIATASNALATAHAADVAALRRGTNELARADARLEAKIDALELTGGMTRLWSSDATTYQDATGVVWQVQVATSLWTVVHSWTTNDLVWDGPWWWGPEGAGEDYYEGTGWYISSSSLTPWLRSEDPYASEIEVEWEYWGDETHVVTTRCTRTVQWLTNAIDRVQYRGDVAAATNGVMAGVTEALNIWAEMGTVTFARQLISEEPGVASVTPSNVWQIAQDATNYTNQVAFEFEDGARTVYQANFASEASTASEAFLLGGYYASDFFQESTNAAKAVVGSATNAVLQAALGAAASKQDALPYPTNAIPYAAIDGAPSGAPEWRVVSFDANTSLSFVTNGMAVKAVNGELFCDRTGWPDGAAMFTRITLAPGDYDIDSHIRLVGYGTWPTNDFQSVWWRSGTNIFVNILLEE